MYLGVQQLNPLTDIQQFLLSQFTTPLSLLHQRPQLIKLSLHQVVASLHNCNVFLQIIIGTESIIQLQLRVLSRNEIENLGD